MAFWQIDRDKAAYQCLKSAKDYKSALYQRGLSTYMVLLGAEVGYIMSIDITQTKLQQLALLFTLYQSLAG